MRSLGADHVIDYNNEDFSQNEERYDVIFDLIGNRSLRALRYALTPTGRYVGAGVLGRNASMIRMLPGMFNGVLSSLFTAQKFVSFMAKSDLGDLPDLAELIQTGKVKPVIDRGFTLDEVPAAVRYVASKRARGKVIISVAD